MIALVRGNPLAKIFMVVTAEALLGRQGLAIGMALGAAVLPIEAGVASRELSGGR